MEKNLQNIMHFIPITKYCKEKGIASILQALNMSWLWLKRLKV